MTQDTSELPFNPFVSDAHRASYEESHLFELATLDIPRTADGFDRIADEMDFFRRNSLPQ